MGCHQHWETCTLSAHNRDPPSCHLTTSFEHWVLWPPRVWVHWLTLAALYCTKDGWTLGFKEQQRTTGGMFLGEKEFTLFSNKH